MSLHGSSLCSKMITPVRRLGLFILKEQYPSDYDITIFPFKANYPIPTPAPLPSPHVNYAKRPPVVAPPTMAIPDHLPPSGRVAMGSRAPSPPTHIEDEEIKPVVKKRDPYEEGAEYDDATRFLRTASPDLIPKQEQDSRSNSIDSFVVEEPINYVVSPLAHQDASPSNVVDDFLASIAVKEEEPMDHVPRQSVSVKEEPLDSNDDEYHPSEELLAAFADLPAEMFNPPPPTTFPGPVKIESDGLAGIPTGSLRERSATLATEADESGHGPRSKSTQIRIKPEPKDESLPPPFLERTRNQRRDRDRSMTLGSNVGDVGFATGIGIKPEPRDDYRIPSLPRTLDGRLAENQIQEEQGVEETTRGRVQLSVSTITPQVRDPRLARERRTQVPQAAYVKSEPKEDYAVPLQPVVRDMLLSCEQGGHLKRVVGNGSNEIEAGEFCKGYYHANRHFLLDVSENEED
ncbi:hypothetical protein C0995_002353 [Termitomyces sp. Mi166|nr:hypothetical protein C0995_002353 [Termitomyces sp. Mi166\